MRRTLIKTALALSMLPAISPGQVASAEGGTAIEAFTPSEVTQGSSISVSGTMATAAQPASVVWTDGTLIQDLPAFDFPYDPNLDLVEGAVEHAKPSDPLTLRIKVAPGPDTLGKPFQWFRWPFQLEERWYFVEFTYVQNGAAGGWVGSWYYCKLSLGSACVHGDTPPFPVSWDAASRTFSGQIPLRDLAAVQPDRTLDQDTMRPFSNQYPPESGYKALAQLQHDNSPPITPTVVPIASMHLGIAPAGTSPDQVAFTHRATPAVSDGSLDVGFVGSVPTDGLAPGSYTVFVKGCFGPCAIDEVPIAITT